LQPGGRKFERRGKPDNPSARNAYFAVIHSSILLRHSGRIPELSRLIKFDASTDGPVSSNERMASRNFLLARILKML